MTANEIIDDLNAPAEVRLELRRFVVALLFLLLNKGMSLTARCGAH
jgi:hypothetical protein